MPRAHTPTASRWGTIETRNVTTDDKGPFTSLGQASRSVCVVRWVAAGRWRLKIGQNSKRRKTKVFAQAGDKKSDTIVSAIHYLVEVG